MIVDNSDINGDYCYMTSCSGFESNNHNTIYYTKKRDEIYSVKYTKENNALPLDVDIALMLPTPSTHT